MTREDVVASLEMLGDAWTKVYEEALANNWIYEEGDTVLLVRPDEPFNCEVLERESLLGHLSLYVSENGYRG